jgi:hypothetical protein
LGFLAIFVMHLCIHCFDVLIRFLFPYVAVRKPHFNLHLAKGFDDKPPHDSKLKDALWRNK